MPETEKQKYYVIARGDSALQLEKSVEYYLENGYKPLGGVSVAVLLDPNADMYIYVEFWAQAMVKDNA